MPNVLKNTIFYNRNYLQIMNAILKTIPGVMKDRYYSLSIIIEAPKGQEVKFFGNMTQLAKWQILHLSRDFSAPPPTK